MPSIPQSLLWISLVVLWLFVLVPMLINKRDTVKRTSDVALATRVLNGRARSRLLRRSGPATGHRHDPEWRRDDADLDDDFRDHEVEDYEEAVREAVHEAAYEARVRTRSMMVVSVTEVSEAVTGPVYLDVDVVDETSGALPVGAGEQASLFETSAETPAEEPAPVVEEPVAPAAETAPVAEESETQPVVDEPAALDDDEYEYIDDTSGLEASEAGEDNHDLVAPRASRRRRLESSATAAAVSARKYRFRKRVLMAMAAVMALTAVLSFTVGAQLWWACGATGAATVLYLAYLRRQTRIEEQVRRRRQHRMARTRAGEEAVVERVVDREVDVVPSRLKRPGAVVLDIDDEDPIFEHLDEVAYTRRYDLPRAAGQ